MNYTLPFLLGVDGLSDKNLKKFNTVKKVQNPDWTPITSKYDFHGNRLNHLRADPVWASILAPIKQSEGGWSCGYVLIPQEFSQSMTVHEYDGSETCSIDFQKYGMQSIRAILDDNALTDSERIEKIKDVYTFIEAHKGIKSYIYVNS